MFPLLLMSLAADEPARCSVSGTVVDSVTGKGISRVEMALEPFERLVNHVAVSTSDAEGRFSIVDVGCGQYRLTGRRGRYIEGRRVVLTLEAGAPVAGIRYRLLAAGAIAGTVRDADGEPVAKAHMILARRRAGVLHGFESIDADDEGHYRFGYLRPGSYYLAVEPPDRAWNKVDHSETRMHPPEARVLTYYPGSADSSGAAPVRVMAGAQMTGVDVTFLRARAYRVRGTVVGAPEGMELALRNQDDLPDLHPSTVTRSGGKFEFNYVSPGSYFLVAVNCRTPVRVASSDVENVQVLTGPGAALNGTIRVEGQQTELGTALVYLNSERGLERVSQVQKEGRFAFRDLPAGRYTLDIHSRPAGQLYVQNIRAGDADVGRDGLRIVGNEAITLDVVMAPGARIGGVVVNERDEPVAFATVVLAPGLQSVMTDQQGRFSIDGLAPGNYLAYAWEDVEDGAWEEPEFLEAYEPEKVAVAERERKALRLKLSSK